MVFCSSKDMKAQYTKSMDVFLKPKPTPTQNEVTEVLKDNDEQDLNSIIDPIGLLIFAGDMNDEQRVEIFTDMTSKLFVKSQMYSNTLELATITKKIIELIPSAGFKTDQARDRIYTQMANMVKRQLEVVNKDKLIDAKSLKADSLTLLISSVDLLVQKLPAS